MLILMLALPLVALYAVLHMIFVVPVAYAGYLIVSALIQPVLDSEADFEIDETTPSRRREEAFHIRVKEIVAANPTALKSVLIGVPAVSLAILTKVPGLFLHS